MNTIQCKIAQTGNIDSRESKILEKQGDDREWEHYGKAGCLRDYRAPEKRRNASVQADTLTKGYDE